MVVKWSALTLAEAMDEVEKLLDQAEPFLVAAEAKALKAADIAYLPQYMDRRLHRLRDTIRGRANARDSIARIRKDIPPDAVEAERQAGRQDAFSLELSHAA
jgi:hypothetical protein